MHHFFVFGLLIWGTVRGNTANITRVEIPTGAGAGPYSRAVRVGYTMYNSGRLGGRPPNPGVVPGGIIPETQQTFEDIMKILEAGGLSLKNVVKATVYLTNWEDYDEMNKVYSEYFTGNYPARSVVQISKLPEGARVFIDVISADTNGER